MRLELNPGGTAMTASELCELLTWIRTHWQGCLIQARMDTLDIYRVVKK